MKQAIDDIQFRQRGRASVEYLMQMLTEVGSVGAAVDTEIAAKVPDPATLPDNLDEREAEMQRHLAGSAAFAVHDLLGDWHGRMHGRIATEAFEEVRDDLEPVLDATEQGPAMLERDPALAMPDYWDGVDFHRTSGGWDRHPQQGTIHSEIVHRKMVARFFKGGIFEQRVKVAKMAARDRYDHILEMGTSSGHFTTALQQAYPDAKITGVELSAQMLEHAWRIANANGWEWLLHQRNAEATGFADDSFDLVTSYILLHELPERAVRNVFKEAFRVVKPGGDLLMSDVTRYADLDKIAAWKADHGARFGGEPHWRESAGLDLAAIARDAGFVDVTAQGHYPHVVQGRKP